jgi:hypothetical protein
MSSIQARNVNHPEYQENLNETKYTIVRDAILAVLPDTGMSFQELEDRVRAHLISQSVSMDLFPKPGSVRWYTKAVQLDLEARGLIERVPGQTPIRLRRNKR